jgi:hypothetical protein
MPMDDCSTGADGEEVVRKIGNLETKEPYLKNPILYLNSTFTINSVAT